MKQKDYKAEIVLKLLRSPAHIRGLAKQLNTNHMTVSRKVKELFKENVVDYRMEGKNKVYFLKKTVETHEHAIISEKYKLIKTLESYPQLRNIIEKIQKDKRIKLAILFGSYAKGLAKKNSDIDLYIKTTNRKIQKELELTDSKLNIKIGKYDRESLLIKEIEKNHVIIKGVEEYYEKNKLFS